MKHGKSLLILAALVFLLAGCGEMDFSAPETTAAATEAPTEAPTEPVVYAGVLEPYFKELYDLSANPCTLELVDDSTIRVNIHQKLMYRRDFVEQAAVGDMLVWPDGQIMIETIDVTGSEQHGYTYVINGDSPDGGVRLTQEMGGEYYLTDADFWPIHAYAKSVDLTSQSGPLTFTDHATDNMELRGKEQSFDDLCRALRNHELEYSTIQNTKVSLGDEFLYTTIYIQSDD